MLNRNIHWLALAAIFAIAPFANFYVGLWCSLILMPYVPFAHGLLVGSIVLTDAMGAAITAVALTAPLAYLTKPQPLLWASLITGSTTATAIYLWQGSFFDTASALTFLEFTMLFFFCWAFGTAFVRLRTRPRALSTNER